MLSVELKLRVRGFDWMRRDLPGRRGPCRMEVLFVQSPSAERCQEVAWRIHSDAVQNCEDASRSIIATVTGDSSKEIVVRLLLVSCLTTTTNTRDETRHQRRQGLPLLFSYTPYTQQRRLNSEPCTWVFGSTRCVHSFATSAVPLEP